MEKKENVGARLKLRAWISQQIGKAESEGKEMFMGIPDEWYEPITYACENGHISHSYLKSEALCDNVCFACYCSVHICPNITEVELAEIIT